MFNIVHCAASNGSGVHLLKVGSKRRRTKQEIKDEQLEAEMRDDAIQAATRRADNLERQLMASQQEAQTNANMAAWTQKFLDKGAARVNERGEVELLDPKKMKSFVTTNIIRNKEDVSQ